MSAPIRIGTRASKLALAQAQMLRDTLASAHSLPPEALEIVPMTTAGDREVQKNPAHWGFKGLFTKELEDALLEGRVDVAVHSMKDMPSILHERLTLAAMLPRADVRDAWISTQHGSYAALPAGAVVGTSSTRRAAQLRHRHPKVQVVPFRGNVQTRLQKLSDGVAEATFLACAGLSRLGMQEWLQNPIATELMLPAVAQGAIGMECRRDDARMQALLAPLDHLPTSICIAAERAFLRVLDGSCRTPIAGLATLDGERLTLQAEVLSLDGSVRHAHLLSGSVTDAIAIGEELGTILHEAAGSQLLESWK